MITRLLIAGVAGFLSFTVFASDDVNGVLSGISNDDPIVLADNRRKDRRDGRQDNRDDKQECRQEEGRIGDDKRECKQENRGDGHDDEDEKEPGAPETSG
jgi:hypothetical protein